MKNACNIFLVIVAIGMQSIAFAQKDLPASRIQSEIILDGQLNELAWKDAAEADSFVVNFPKVGELSKFKTSVKMVYDEQAIYFGIVLDDPVSDSVLSFLSQRDDFGNADWIGILIDPYGAGQNGFGFYVTAAGVEIDLIINQTDNDLSWNAVWKSKVQLTKTGWVAEVRIPYTQLRFPNKPVQTWKINFKRQVRRCRESSFWSPVDPQKYGEIAQSGTVSNLVNLVSPLRLSFSPYTTAYLENYYDNQSQSQIWGFRQRFGMDVKYGLSESFTLDATLVPDFGQTVSDNLVLNLSPFEVRYNENRPFFLEGMDLFGIGDIFYTRRIGDFTYKGQAVVDSLSAAGREVVSAPSLAQLVNATKISGRTKNGLGVGVFNAVEKRSVVTYKDSLGETREALAHPFSNYNVFVLSQNLKNNNNIGLINSNVLRPEVGAIANVTSAQALFFTKNRRYQFNANSQYSINQRGNYTIGGHTAFASIAKVQGTVVANVDYYECSNTYDPNELGFLPRNNFRGVYAGVKWTGYEPTGRFLRRTASLSTNLEYLYLPSKFAYWQVDGNAIATFKNFLTAGLQFNAFPIGEVDHFESRTFGIPLNYPASVQVGGFYSSDYSKKFALDFSAYNRVYAKEGMDVLDLNVSPRFRFSPRLFVVPSVDVSRFFRNYGYVRVTDTTFQDKIIIGTRNRWVVNNAISADYTFTNRMGLVLRLNHYWQEVNYINFNELAADGSLLPTTYTGIQTTGDNRHHTSFNAFTVDMNFRWVIYPGSEIRFVWKYNIYASKQGLDLNYFYTFKELFSQPQLNSFSIRALFFLDAGKWKKTKKP